MQAQMTAVFSDSTRQTVLSGSFHVYLVEDNVARSGDSKEVFTDDVRYGVGRNDGEEETDELIDSILIKIITSILSEK